MKWTVDSIFSHIYFISKICLETNWKELISWHCCEWSGFLHLLCTVWGWAFSPMPLREVKYGILVSLLQLDGISRKHVIRIEFRWRLYYLKFCFLRFALTVAISNRRNNLIYLFSRAASTDLSISLNIRLISSTPFFFRNSIGNSWIPDLLFGLYHRQA